jgi:hypothetical protein
LGLDREHLAAHLHLLTQFTPSAPAATKQAIHTLTIAGGHGKVGQPEAESLVVTAGEIVCIVG